MESFENIFIFGIAAIVILRFGLGGVADAIKDVAVALKSIAASLNKK